MYEYLNPETEARVNALRQLLTNTQPDVIKAFEGRMTQAEYEELRATRQAWKDELATLGGTPADQEGTDVLLTTISSRSTSSIMFVLEAQAEDSRLDDVTIAEHADLFPVWDEHWTGKAGTIVQDEGQLYRSIHDVGAGQNTKPSETPAMWTRIGNPAEEYPEWIQPIGSHDAYKAGDKVTHSGKRWVNTHGDGNIWEPGVYGWEEVA
ncbi:hypothetical protein LJC74_03055 [Eubacteriales bacterium OttesenSCG-928-A19]|nr:hypothetical protein [Eubacteriales bacterium OttesenSCG-928-A19]